MNDSLKEAVKLRYSSMGLKVDEQFDEKGATWGPHQHEATYLFILEGSIKVKIDDDWIELFPNDELFIEKEQLHETIAGNEGCLYIFAS